MKALITGITGQDGSYLAELLLEKGYEVHGIIRRASTFNTQRIEHLYQDPHDRKRKLILHYGDLLDAGQVTQTIYNIEPDEVYHLGAQSHVRVSFDLPTFTGDVVGLGTTRILEAMRKAGSKAHFYQASSSEMFGSTAPPQNEETPFSPQSPYAAAKVYAYYMVRNFRDAYNMFATNGILFNHESPRRGETFVTRKITRAVARIRFNLQDCLYLGNVDAKRDWGYAKDYVEAMWLMLQQERPDDFVIATGETHSVREFCETAFQEVGIELGWKGKGVDEIGFVISTQGDDELLPKRGTTVIRIDPQYFRPTEVDALQGDPSKAKQILGWEPKVSFKELTKIMMKADIEELTQLKRAGDVMSALKTLSGKPNTEEPNDHRKGQA